MENEQTNLPPNFEKKKLPWGARLFFRFLIFIFILFILIVGAGFVIGYYYQDEVKEYVIQELNKHLNTEIIVNGKDIDFTVLKNFPNASIEFKNIKALDATTRKHKDTLFKAEEISLQFNILDVFYKKYHVKKIELQDGELNIKVFKDGSDNFHFWKTSTDSSVSNISFALENIEIRNIQFIYKDYKLKQNYNLQVIKSKVNGEFNAEHYTLTSSGDLFVNSFKIDSTTYLSNKKVNAKIKLDVDNKIDAYKINSAQIQIEDLLFEAFGNVINANGSAVVNFAVKGKDMNIQSVLSLIPARYKDKIKEYESNGEFYFSSTIQGSWANNQTPQIVADFGINNADIKQTKDDLSLHNVTLKGHFSNGDESKNQPSQLILNNISATFNERNLAGELVLHNLSNPSFNGKIKAYIALELLQKFIRLDTIESITGEMKIDATFSGDKKNMANGKYENITTAGTLEIKDAGLKIKNNQNVFSKINGDFIFDNNDLGITNFSGNYASSDFEMEGYFRNIGGFMLKENQDITIEASLKSKNINLNELLANKENDSDEKSIYKLKFSEHIDVNLNSEIQHLEFRKFVATDVKGVIKLKDKKLIVDPISLRTMEGTITTSGLVDGTDSSKLLVTCFSELNKINITKLFSSFENFGQTAITDKNIKGTGSAKINFASELSPELKIDLNKLYAAVDMTIDNGELNNVEALKSLSKFIELDELENIRFSTIKNQIEIKNQIISIPKMEVNSSAMNITLSGTHTFKNEINYKIKLSLNELLSKKVRKNKKGNDEFGEVADDGLGRSNIFLSMTGTLENPVIKYDSKSAVQNVKNDLKVEKQTLKTILKEEFGLFKKDSTLKKTTPKQDGKIIIDWDEATKKEEKKELKKPKKPEEEDF